MAVFYGTYTTPRSSNPVAVMDGDAQGGRVRNYQEKITLATQTTSDTIVIAFPPAGALFLYGLLTTSVSLGTSTIAIGITGTTGKYRAAATFTTTDTPTLFGVNTAKTAKLTAAETIFITIATASLPGSGTLYTDMVFASA